jgi:hypothetical protein
MSRWQWSFALRGTLLAALALVPATVLAQNAEIAGVVRDTSGAVLPGVTVEASSPALIEKSRTVFTDTQGQYRIIALNAGTYRVTFALSGFKTVAREGIVLTAQFTAGVDVSLEVGSLEETITVSGQSPLVDVQADDPAPRAHRRTDQRAAHRPLVPEPRHPGARRAGAAHLPGRRRI